MTEQITIIILHQMQQKERGKDQQESAQKSEILLDYGLPAESHTPTNQSEMDAQITARKIILCCCRKLVFCLPLRQELSLRFFGLLH